MGRIRQIRRDDGSLIPFRERKIADAVEEALKAAGTGDRALADELAGVVTLFLEKYHAEAVPSLGDIEEMMGRVLRETGHARAARALEDLQRERRRLQEELVVRPSAPEGGDDGRAYDRAALVRGLVEARELPEVLAEEIAAAVEQRLIRSGLKSVTTAFLRELVEYDLRDRGIETGTGDERLPGLRRAELARVLKGDVGAGLPERMLAAPAFQAFALSGIHTVPVAKAHLEARIHLHGLDDPLRVERVCIPAALLLGEAPGPVAETLLRVRRLLDGVRDHVRSSILLWDLAGSLASSSLPDAGPEQLAHELLLALDWRDAWDRPVPPLTHLAIPIRPLEGTSSSGRRFLNSLLGLTMRAAEPAHRLPVTLVSGGNAEMPDDDAVLAGLLDAAAARADTCLAFPRPGDPPVSSLRRVLPIPLQASLGRVALNLPLALATGIEAQSVTATASLEEPARLALSAFTERFWHQRQGGVQGLHGIVVRLGGPGHVQVNAEGQEVDAEVWGLTLAIEILVRRGIIRHSERPATAARILAFLDYVLGEAQNGVRFRVRLGGATGRDVRRRFLDALESSADRYGVGDVQDLLREGARERNSLPVVIPLFSPSNATLIGSPFSERLAPGLTLPLAAFGTSSPGTLLRRVREETRLGLLNLAPRRPGDDSFEVQEELF